MYEYVGVEVEWKRRGREAEKRMILDAFCSRELINDTF